MRPTWKTILVSFVVANTALLVWFWLQTSGVMLTHPWASGGPAVAWGRITGLLLELALLLQLVLIGRVTWIEQAFGHDGLNRMHRWLGYALVALLIAHPLLLSIGYGFIQAQSVVPAFIGLTTQWDNVLNAAIAVLLFFGVIALSVPWVRSRLKYEHWHLAHLLTYIAIALAFGHQIENGGDFRSSALTAYWYVLNFGVFGLYFVYRFLRPLVVTAKHRFVVERVERVSPDAWSIVVTGRNMESFRFRAGQFAILQFAARGLWTPHPFSFSHEYDGRTLRFTVKELGDATKRIQLLRPGTHVLIDGPLGVFTPRTAVTEKYLLIAGGIGITPIRAMAGELAARGADVVVLYAIRNSEHAAFADEIRKQGVPLMLFVSQPVATLPPGAVEGTIDSASIQRFVPDVALRDVYICGPSLMMDALAATLRSMGVRKSQIHMEQFGYGNSSLSPWMRRFMTGGALIGVGAVLAWFAFLALNSTGPSITVQESTPTPSVALPSSTSTPLASTQPPTSTPVPTVAATKTPSATPPGTYTMADVAKHNSGSSCWTAVNGTVYDITPYADMHPGGAGAILSMCGIDASSAFDAQHGGQRRPASELASFRIGTLAN